MKRRRLFAVILAIVMIATLMVACNKTETEQTDTVKTDNGEGSTTENNVEPKRDDIIIGVNGEPLGFDPSNTSDGYSNTVELQLYDGLVQFDADRNVIGNIAESWEISEDSLIYTFKIKSGIKFHDGTELTVEDVKYSLDLAKESPYTSSMNKMETITIVDENTIEITLGAPYVLFLEKLARPDGAGIVCKAAREADVEGYMENPVGTGPYMIKEWEKGTKIVLEAFEDYHQGAAQIKTATMRFLPEATTATIAVEAGEIDLTNNVSPADLPAINTDKVGIYESPSFHFNYLILNTMVDALSDVKVRQAMVHALDKESVIIAALEGHGTVANTIVREDAPGFADIDYRGYDVAKAKQLMAESSFPEGFEIEMLVIGGSYSSKIAEMAQANWAEIGITLTIQSLEASAFIEDIGAGKHQIAWFAFDNSTNDASQYSIAVHSAGPYNASIYANDDVDEALDMLNTMTKAEVREPYVKVLQENIDNDAPIIPLFWRNEIIIGDKEITGVDGLFVQFNIYRLGW